MSNIIRFPEVTHSDRALVHSIIESFSRGKCDRNTMMKQLSYIMEQKRIRKMPIFGYTIHRNTVVDSEGKVAVVTIEGSQVVDRCPCCGNDEEDSRYLYTNKENLTGTFDIITVTCLKCWCIYSVKAKNGRKKWNAMEHTEG